MQTKKQAILDAYHHKVPEYVPYFNISNARYFCPTDRYNGPGIRGDDMFGVHWLDSAPENPLSGPSPDPYLPPLLDDICNWRNVSFPDLNSINWKKEASDFLNEVDRNEKIVMVTLFSGLFERMNQMLGMEEALCAFYEEPDEVKELFAALADWKLDLIDRVAFHFTPDVIQMHDDWGTNNNMFFAPDIWREFIKPHEKRFAERIHSHGIIYQHHSCGYITPIIADMIEIGIDAWDPVNVCNDIAGIKKNYGRKITLVGGFDNQRIESEHISGPQLEAEIKKSLDVLAPGGSFVSYFLPLMDNLKWQEVGRIMTGGMQNNYY